MAASAFGDNGSLADPLKRGTLQPEHRDVEPCIKCGRFVDVEQNSDLCWTCAHNGGHSYPIRITADGNKAKDDEHERR